MTVAIRDAASADEIPSSTPAVVNVERSLRKSMIMGAVAAVAVATGGGYYVLHHGIETTDDAQVDADVVSVASRATGTVASIHFEENQEVKKGALLAEVDPEPAKARLAQAEANLEAARAAADAADADASVAETSARGNKSVAEASLRGAASGASASKEQIAEAESQVVAAQANYDRASVDHDRYKSLSASGAIPQAELDRSEAGFVAASSALAQTKAHVAMLEATTSQAYSRVQEARAKLTLSSDVEALIAQAHARARMAHANVNVARAARDLAALDLSYTRILAPEDGVVSKKTIVVGQNVASGQPIVQLVPVHNNWITANFKETQVTRMHKGQAVEIELDTYPGVHLQGVVGSTSAATGSRFTLLPPDNATGNFTKVVQRVPVRIALHDLPSGLVLRPGMSADVAVDTRR
jgi:membrane fusion protein (multidrug efflux system)